MLLAWIPPTFAAASTTTVADVQQTNAAPLDREGRALDDGLELWCSRRGPSPADCTSGHSSSLKDRKAVTGSDQRHSLANHRKTLTFEIGLFLASSRQPDHLSNQFLKCGGGRPAQLILGFAWIARVSTPGRAE